MKLNLDPDRKIKLPVDGGTIHFKLKEIMAVPGEKISLKRDFDPDFTGGYRNKEGAVRQVAENVERLSALQDKLYAQDSYALLIIFQAIDAAGKDSAIRHVMSGVNPQGCHVTSFKAPSSQELDHDYLWRTSKELPARGMIGIFNRSYYEEVLVVRVHPELLAKQKLPELEVGGAFWKRRFREINNFEKYLTDNGTIVVKFFLNVSKEEQKKRFLDRIDEAEKNWKFEPADARERAHWDDYQHAYEDMLNNTSTADAPWFVIPADNKWFARLAISEAICSTLERLNLEYPKVDKARRTELQQIRRALEEE